MKQSAKGLSVAFLFDDTLDNDAGVAQYVKTLGSWLAANGHTVDYIVGQSQKKRPEGKVISGARNIKVRWAGNRLSMPLWPNRGIIKELLSEKQYDLVHLQAPYSPLMSKYVIGKLPVETALVATFHIYPANKLSEHGGRLLKLAYGRSFKRIDKFLSVSSAAAEYAQKIFKVDSQISPNAIDVTRFSASATHTKKTNHRIVFLGRLVKRKGCAELLKACALLSPDLKYELIIGGDGPERSKLEAIAKSLNLESKIKFLGYVEEQNKPDLLASADLAVFPSLFAESFGISLTEAMAAGTLVLGGDNPGYRSVLGDQSELLIDPLNDQKFAARLERLLRVVQLRNRLIAWQSHEVKQYDINKVGPELLKIYRSTIANRLANR